tara:strand:- start:2268 stop:3323 length:1056 start_codon:yes stop_codon:yes gene_type:complete
MESINFNSSRLTEILDNLNPNNSGIFFSLLIHLIILLFAVGIPNIFASKNIYIPNIVPIEILNVSDVTNTEKSETKKEESKNILSEKKKFNSSETLEVQKQFEITENIKTFDEENQPIINVKEKSDLKIEQKKKIQVKQKNLIQPDTEIETLKTNEIKPKLKPKLNEIQPLNNSDIQITPKSKKQLNAKKSEKINKPKQKPKEDFSIASMLKDLRNEKSNNVIEDKKEQEKNDQTGQNENNENMVLSISEIDLLRQQLSSCWNAPAGAVINIGDKVTISAKVQQNMKVFPNSVRIVDTNISKSNPFYSPITDSAMRTLLNPECTPLKLPKDKYNLWKNLTITFDYSIMKGY